MILVLPVMVEHMKPKWTWISLFLPKTMLLHLLFQRRPPLPKTPPSPFQCCQLGNAIILLDDASETLNEVELSLTVQQRNSHAWRHR